jgi:hypothetical protein
MNRPATIVTAVAVALSGLAATAPPPAAANPAAPAARTQPAQGEKLQYRWRLKGLMGRLATAVLPGAGDAELRSYGLGKGRTVTELEITSPEAASGEHFLYGAETGPGWRTREAWSSYQWRERQKSERQLVHDEGVVDIASAILLVRASLPQHTTMRIWSDGRIYPVVVRRVGIERVRVPAGEFQAVRYEVRGIQVPGQRVWKGGLDLWLAEDEVATPVQIQVSRGWANVLLELTPARRP